MRACERCAGGNGQSAAASRTPTVHHRGGALISTTVSRADTELVTKADLKAELHAAIASLERRLIGYQVAAVLIVLAAIKYL